MTAKEFLWKLLDGWFEHYNDYESHKEDAFDDAVYVMHKMGYIDEAEKQELYDAYEPAEKRYLEAMRQRKDREEAERAEYRRLHPPQPVELGPVARKFCDAVASVSNNRWSRGVQELSKVDFPCLGG